VLLRWALVLVVPLAFLGCSAGARPRVVVYCAQDEEFARQLFADFGRQTGLQVLPSYDTEATKSVSLYEKLLREHDRPRCDVFWNNEILSTIRLQKQGLLEPYLSPSANPYPPGVPRGPDGSWYSFAARARVLLVNTKMVPRKADRPRGLFDLLKPRWKGQVAMAKPEFGTTATQAACLFQALGKKEARRFYLGLRDNGVQIRAGNKQVAEGVGNGEVAVGLTDTDDALEEVKAGHPVAIIFPDRDGDRAHPNLGTLFIPNTVAIVRGSPDPEGARRLVDYLLSAEVETRLAEGGSHQIPLNPTVRAKLPPELATPWTVRRVMRVDFVKAADLWDEVQSFLRNEFARP
jgi:iron(III) transport system substrate-binding protein